MEINTNTYGTHGLPVFGKNGIDYGTRAEVITRTEKAFAAFLAGIKADMYKGNEVELLAFANGLESIWFKALKTVAGIHVVNN